jgi:hypothetical protein
MYRALKSAQVDMNEVLLKFVDEVTQVAASHGDTRNPSDSGNLGPLEVSIVNIMNQQNAQFNHITTSLQNLNNTMMTILNLMNNQKNASVNMADKIPSIQPTSSNTDLKDICIAADISNIEHEEDLNADIQPGENDAEPAEEEQDLDADIQPDENVEEAEEVEVAEEEVVEEEVEQEEVEEEVEQEEVEEQEELEVEEWSYKGRLFFKDAENTVYLNDGGELGDPVGIYDPVKNIVKKLPSN